MGVVVQMMGTDLVKEINAHRERFARAVRAAFAAGAERVVLVDGEHEVGWIEADGRSHFKVPPLPFDGRWDYDG